MYDYRCDICGCRLDPGEGRACDECREKTDSKENPAKIVYVEREVCRAG